MDFERMRQRLRGDLLTPDQSGYDMARKLWNGMMDKRPAAIARCAGAADVMSAIDFARNSGLGVSVRGGGHNVAGMAVQDGALTIDLSRMRSVRVDPRNKTVRAEGGVTWGEFDQETLAFGLVTTGGAISTTGIAGLTLGGGVGWLMGKHGLACDNLISADVITADGKLLTASEQHNADLFWALRGGGGNFGVVTSFEYALHDLEPITGGLAIYPADVIPELFRFFDEFTRATPPSVMTMGGILNGPPGTPLAGSQVGAIAVCHSGPPDEGAKLLKPIKALGPPAIDTIGPMPYTAIQTMLDAGYPPGQRNYWRSNFLGGLDAKLFDTILDQASGLSNFGGSAILFEHIHGAAKDVPDDATAFANRHASYNLTALSVWERPEDDAKNIEWTRRFGDSLKPFATGSGYVNYMTDDEGPERVKATYGAHYERLVGIKRKYDADNFFKGNQNIRP